jgi:hypothetical protein
MPLFLITSLYDEGISPNLFRVVEAESTLAIAQHMLEHPNQWSYFLYRSFHQEVVGQSPTPAQFLERIEHTHVDGDSTAQLRITEVRVQSLAQLDTNPAFRPGTLFSDFG